MFEEIMSNRILVAGATSWALAQILKTLVNFIEWIKCYNQEQE